MLIVMGIMAILTGVSAVAVNSLLSASRVDSGAYNVSSFVELARNEAIARRSYVWVGFTNVTVGPAAPQLVVAAVASIDGSTNSTQSNLLPLAPPLHVPGVALSNWSSLKTATQALFTGGATDSISTNTAGISFTAGTAQFTGTTITVTPRGQALLKGVPSARDGYIQYMDISFLQAIGSHVTNRNDASVVLDGSTGNPSIVQVQ